MKKIALLFVTLFFISPSSYGQQLPQLFEENGDAITDARVIFDKRLQAIKNNHDYLEVRNVRFGDLAQIAESTSLEENPGYFRFSIQKTQKSNGISQVLVMPKHIEASEAGDYSLHADLLAGRDETGDLVLIHQNGQHFGSMRIGDREFRIEHLDTGEQVLIELNKERLKRAKQCGVKKSFAKSNELSTTFNPSAASSSSNNNVRVLVMFTERARRVSNPAQLAPTMINELHMALNNSKVYSNQLRFTLAGVEQIKYFSESPNALNDFNRLVIHNDLNTRRRATKADLVVVLTDANYPDILGLAALYDYADPNLGHVAIVEADAGNLTFVHEVGHLMGCRHDTDSETVPNLSNTAKGYTWKIKRFLRLDRYEKSVVADGRTFGTARPFFSNPSVKAHKKANRKTGTSNNNNAAQLRAAASVVSNYIDFEEMLVSIVAPSRVDYDEPFRVSTSIRNCPSRRYRWELSTSGFHYEYVGSGSSFSLTADEYTSENAHALYFRVTVTCSDGQKKTAHKTVRIDSPSYFFGALPNADLGEVAKGSSIAKGNSSMPLQVSDQVNLNAEINSEDDVSVKLFSLVTGEQIAVDDGYIDVSNNHLSVDLSQLDQGLYDVVISESGEQISSSRLFINRQ